MSTAPITFTNIQPIESGSSAQPSQSGYPGQAGQSGAQPSADSAPAPITFTNITPIAPSQPTVQISAIPNSTIADKVKNWSNAVAGDLLNGTDATGIGSLLKKLGAPGLQSGVSPEVAQFMGSLPLGVLKMVRGTAEAAQPGQFGRGLKDTAEGGLQAATIPSEFVAPEAGDTAGDILQEGGGKAAQTVSNAASKVKKAVTGPFSSSEARQAAQDARAAADQAATEAEEATNAVQPALQSKLRAVLTDTAKDIGVKPPDENTSIRDAAHEIGEAALKKAQTDIYQKLDKISGGRWQRFTDQLSATKRALRDDTGVDEDATAKLEQKKSDLEKSIQQVKDEATAQGVDPNDIKKADALWKQGKALQKLGNHIRASTTGRALTPAEEETESALEAVNPTSYYRSMNKLYDNGVLQNAVGKDRAEQVLNHGVEAVNNMKAAKEAKAASREAEQLAGKKEAELAARQRTVRNRKIGAALAIPAAPAVSHLVHAARSPGVQEALGGLL